MSRPYFKKEFSPMADVKDTSVSATPAQAESSPLLPEPDWQTYEEDNVVKRIAIKEFAVREGETFVKNIRGILEKYLPKVESARPRITKATTILGRQKKRPEIFVGFLGATGSGKTTLINSLVGYPDLLPSSIQEACTAVPVEISHNYEDAVFRANIIYFTREEWRVELDQTFTDIAALPQKNERECDTDDDDDEDDEDLELLARIDKAHDKLKCVYPHLTSLEELKSSNVEALLNHRDVRDIITDKPFKNCIVEESRAAFTAAIRSYVVGGDSESETMDHWPLVKQVQISVYSPFLAAGIVLVDLPGNLDNNAARSAIAEAYQKKLTITCIVAYTIRAMSDGNALELLELSARRNLQLDGLYRPQTLCFITTKNDEFFDPITYLLNNSKLAKRCAGLKKDYLESVKRHREFTKERESALETHRKNEKLVKALESRLTEIHQLLHYDQDGTTSKAQKRKRIDDDETVPSNEPGIEQRQLRNEQLSLQAELSKARRERLPDLSALERRKSSVDKTLWQCESNLRVACINNRDQVTSASIKKGFNATLKELNCKQSSDELQVFCVSAHLHLKYLRSPAEKHMGFPNIQDTQISALKDWLIRSTWVPREQCSQAFNEDVDNLRVSMLPWIMNKYGEVKMTTTTRATWEGRMNHEVVALRKEFYRLTDTLILQIKGNVKATLFGRFTAIHRSAAKEAPEIARGWCIGMHWSTHRQINRCKGQLTDKKGHHYNWNKDLSVALTNPLFNGRWITTFFADPDSKNIAFTPEYKSFVEEGQTLILTFADDVTDETHYPDMKDALDVLKDNILRTQGLLQSQALAAFEQITKMVRDAHPVIIPAIQKYLEPLYRQCGAAQGRKHFFNNKAAHQAKLEANGEDMYKAATKALKAAVERVLEQLSELLKSRVALIMDEIQDAVVQFFDGNTGRGDQVAPRVISEDKLQMQAELLQEFRRLANRWCSEVPALVEPAIDESDMPPDLGDRFFRDTSKD